MAWNIRTSSSPGSTVGVPPPRYTESTNGSSSPPISSVIFSAPAISRQTFSTYLPNIAFENTPDAKLQYVHFVRQNGTEMYRPSGTYRLSHSPLWHALAEAIWVTEPPPRRRDPG